MTAMVRISGALPCAASVANIPGGESRTASACVYSAVRPLVIVFPAHEGITVDVVRIGSLALLAGGGPEASGILLDNALRWRLPVTADLTPAVPMQFELTNHNGKLVEVKGIVVWCRRYHLGERS